MVHVNGSLYLFGGMSSSSANGWMDDVHEFNLATNTWGPLVVQGDIPSQCDKLTGVAHDNKVYVRTRWERECV